MSSEHGLPGTTIRGVATSPAAADERLRGRTYAVPFEDVWQAALALASGGLRGWRMLTADDHEGVITAEAERSFPRALDDITIDVRLDENAQTRVDARAAPRNGRADFGRNARRLGHLFRSLDAEVERAAARRRATARPA